MFRFLLKDYHWFVDNISEIKKLLKQEDARPELLDSIDLRIDTLGMTLHDKEAKGKLIASELIKDTFKS